MSQGVCQGNLWFSLVSSCSLWSLCWRWLSASGAAGSLVLVLAPCSGLSRGVSSGSGGSLVLVVFFLFGSGLFGGVASQLLVVLALWF